MSLTPSSPTSVSAPMEPEPVGSALPPYWTAQALDDGLRIVPPANTPVGAFALLVIVLLAGGFTPSPGAWWPPVWISLAAACGLWVAVNLPQTEWRIGPNFMEIRRSFQGRQWVERRFQDATLRATKSGGEYWGLQACDQRNVRTVYSPESVEQLAQVADILSAHTGWMLTSPDGSTAVLRELLIRALDAKDPRRLTHLLKDGDAAATIAVIWRGRPSSSRRGVAERLARVTDVTALLLRAVESADWHARAAAVDLLGEHGEPAVVPRIRQALSDPVEAVRVRAATALAPIQDQDSVGPLCAALNHGGEFPLTAAWALGEIRDPRAVPELSDVLISGERLAEGELRRTAATALGRIGDRVAAPVLCRALSDPAAGVRESAAEALGTLCCPSAAPALRNALADTVEAVVVQAIAALSMLRDQTAIEPLGGCLQHESSCVRAGAVQALGELGSEAAIPLLCGALRDDHANVRRAAAQALAGLAEAYDDAPVRLRAAVALLEKMCARFSTERGDVKRACALALTQIERRTASVKDLPLPSSLTIPATTNLPRTVDAAAPAPLQIQQVFGEDS